jgi:alanine-glyoxylate transaminase / serine-glyoxylate transaminase / serine-pyruvate transaminase
MSYPSFVAPSRVLLGPGPSEIHPSVLRAMGQPTMGHLDPELLKVQDELRAMLASIFGTQHGSALAISGTGTAAMEAAFVNAIEPGDAVVVVTHGYFGDRMVEIATRCGANVTVVKGEWGRATDPAAVRAAAPASFKLLCAVHAETSTGVRQDLAPLAAFAHERGALLLADCVTSLGCIPVDFDATGIDIAYSCSQKGLSCPPGSSPLAVSAAARDRIAKRQTKCRSFYLDFALLHDYWSGARGYHHTASSNQLVALHEACRLVLEEGLPARFARQEAIAESFVAGCEELGLTPLVPRSERLPQLLVLRIPEGVDDMKVRGRLLREFGIEIGGGLGAFKGKVWRVGLMGTGATPRNATLLHGALRRCLES